MWTVPKTVTRQGSGCDLNPGPSAPESSMLTTWLPSHPAAAVNYYPLWAIPVPQPSVTDSDSYLCLLLLYFPWLLQVFTIPFPPVCDLCSFSQIFASCWLDTLQTWVKLLSHWFDYLEELPEISYCLRCFQFHAHAFQLNKVAHTRRVQELIPVLGSQPTGDVSHKPGGKQPLLTPGLQLLSQPLRGLLPISLLRQ